MNLILEIINKHFFLCRSFSLEYRLSSYDFIRGAILYALLMEDINKKQYDYIFDKLKKFLTYNNINEE